MTVVDMGSAEWFAVSKMNEALEDTRWMRPLAGFEVPGFKLYQVRSYQGLAELGFVVVCGGAAERFTVHLAELVAQRRVWVDRTWVNLAEEIAERMWSRWMAL